MADSSFPPSSDSSANSSITGGAQKPDESAEHHHSTDTSSPEKKKRLLLGSLTGGTMALFLFAGFSYYFLRAGVPPGDEVIIPTLALNPVELSGADYSARLIGEQEGIEVHYFTADEATTGFTALADKHVLFDCPADTTPNISVIVAHGDRKSFREKRSWGYEYSGNEAANKTAGKIGLALFDGRFWLSAGELAITGDQFGYLDTENMMMIPDKRYYLMSEADMRVSCLDSDQDHLNNRREDLNGNGVVDAGETDPHDADTDDDGFSDGLEIERGFMPTLSDTDGDGIQDGTEAGLISGTEFDTDPSIFIPDANPSTTTDPINPDTDGGGVSDGAEDIDHNGRVDAGETDPDDPSDDAAPVECGNGVLDQDEGCDDGNSDAEDGCSALCAVEDGFECLGEPSTCTPIIPQLGSLLNVAVRANGSTDVAVENEQDITLLVFDVLPGDNDVTLVGASFTAQQGSLADLTDYTLKADTTSNGEVDSVVEQGVSAQNGNVTFNFAGGQNFSAHSTTRYAVTADVGGSITPSLFRLQFATAEAGYIEAHVTVDDSPLSGISTDGTCDADPDPCQIAVSTLPAIEWELVEQGNLFVTQSVIPISSHQLLAGAEGEEVLHMKFVAEHEDIDVTRLEFIGAGIVDSVQSLKLYTVGEQTPFVTATTGACQVSGGQQNTFCALMESQQLVVSEGDSVDVLVHPLLKTDEEGSRSGDAFHFYFGNGPSSDQDGNQWGPGARGVTSSNILAYDNGNGNDNEGEMILADVSGEENDVVLAKIMTIEDANPADGTNVPVGVNKTIAEFRFTAAANTNTLNGRNVATIDGIVFSVASANVAFADEFDLYNKNDQTQQISCTSTGLSDSFLVQCLRSDNPSVDLGMDSGDSITLVLEADITNNQVNAQGSSLQVSLTDFSDRSLAGAFGTAAGESHIRFSDSLLDASPTFFRWIEYDLTQIPSTLYRIQ